MSLTRQTDVSTKLLSAVLVFFLMARSRTGVSGDVKEAPSCLLTVCSSVCFMVLCCLPHILLLILI